jgi:hypothetical protein
VVAVNFSYLVADRHVCGTLGAGRLARCSAAGPISTGDEVQDLCENRHSLCPAPRREHVVR